jgi:exosome complex component RRP42
MSSILISGLRRDRISQLIKTGKRLDGRTPTDYREIRIESGIIERAEGSAQAHLGKTRVLTGIKIGVGEPYPDRPRDGVLTVNAELVPLASPEFEGGRPGEEAIELARVVDRGIRESEAISLEELCIVPEKKVFIVFVDVYVLNHDGNLIDASAISALSALLNTKMPNYEVQNGEIKKELGFSKLPMRDYPIPITFADIDGSLIMDPTLDEENAMNTRLSITFDKDGKICAVQKGGRGTLTKERIMKAAKIGQEKAKEIRSLLVKK